MTHLLHLGATNGPRLSVAPGRGGKITSLRDASGREWLSQPRAGGLSAHSPTGLAFTDAEMCGWDECAPTIDAATLADGTSLTDHGDVWDQPWQAHREGERITTIARGADWPYEMERTIRLEGNRVLLDYRVTSRADRPRPFLWAAHPQFLAPPGTRVFLEGTETMMRTDPAPTSVVTWDPALPDLAAGSCAKWWSPADACVTRARLERPGGAALTLSASGSPVRWLGVWADAHVWSAERVIALEPATGWYDDARRAWDARRVLVLEPHQCAQWSLTLDFIPDPSLPKEHHDLP